MGSKNQTVKTFEEEFLSLDLRKSGITVEEARGYFRALSPAETGKLTKKYTCLSMRIPYHHPLTGEPMTFNRLKLLTKPKTFGKPMQNAPRYWQTPNTLPHIYFAPNVKGWTALLKDVRKRLIICEGEKKAFALSKHGLPALGLGGVWSFKSKKAGLSSLKDFYLVEWKGRIVELVFDSDAYERTDLLATLRTLAQELTRRGAKVSIVTLPGREDGEKNGIDDYLLDHTVADYEALPRERFEDEFARLNENYGIIEDRGAVAKLESGKLLSYGHFRNFNGARYAQTVITPNGPQARSVVELWIASPNANLYQDIIFVPGEERDVINKDGRFYNAWRGWAVEPQPGDTGVLDALLEHLFVGQDTERGYFENLIAYKVQHPDVKIPVVPLLYSDVQGTGKSILGNLLGTMFGAHYSWAPGNQLNSNFNEFARLALFAVIDELEITDKQKSAGALKALFSEREIWINEKYGPKWKSPNLIFFYVTTNNSAPLYLERTDRRIFMVEVCRGQTKQKGILPEGLRRKVAALLPPPSNPRALPQPEIVAAMLHRYLHRNLKGFDPFAAPLVTAAKEEATDISAGDLGRWARDLMENPERWWIKPFSIRESTGEVNPCDFAETREVVELYNSWHHDNSLKPGPGDETRMGMALNKAGSVSIGKIRTKNGPVRLRVIRNIARWRPIILALQGCDNEARVTAHEEIRNHYDATTPYLIARRVKYEK